MVHTHTKSKPSPKVSGAPLSVATPLRQPRHWREVLRAAGYPLDLIIIDFENYFEDSKGYSIRNKDMSTVQYIMDDRFENLGISVLTMPASHPDKDYEDGCHWFNGEDGVTEALRNLRHVYGPDLARATVAAHNARYDAAVLAFRFHIYPRYLIDILGLARHWDSRNKNDLGSLAERLGTPPKGNTKKFIGWTNRRRMIKSTSRKKGPKLPIQMPRMTEAQQQEVGDYANNDVAREYEQLVNLLPKLSRPEIELPLMQHTLELYTKPELCVDSVVGDELVGKMQARMREVVEQSGLTESDLRSGTFDEVLFNRLDQIDQDPDSYTKPAANCKRGWKIASAKGDSQREQLERHEDPQVRALMAAKAAVDSWPNHISRVRRIVVQAQASPNGRLPVPLKYCGAHTRRWSGDEQINLQNLGERNPEPLIQDVRKLLIAPPGKKILIGDLSAIEARGTGWIAGQWDLVEKFRKGEEIYCAFATRVLGYRVRKPREGGIKQIEDRYKWARNSVGKVGVLGCGYGMGAMKAVAYSGDAITLELAEKLVKTYREENPEIVKFWRNAERCFRYTLKYGRTSQMDRGLLFYATDDCDVIIQLPSGGELKYHKARICDGKYGEGLQVYNSLNREWGHIWGGHLTENIVQSFCRDLLAEAALRCEARGVPIKLHVHDELVGVVDEDQAETSAEIIHEELTRPCPWAPELPLGADPVKITDRYGGH